MTLRTRLTLLYLAIASLAIGGLGVTAYIVARDATFRSVDETLEAEARTIESSFDHLGGPVTADDIDESRLTLDRQAVEGLVFQVLGEDGRVLYSSSGGTPLPGTQAGVPMRGWRTFELSGNDTRLLTRPLVRFGATIGFVEVRTPLSSAEATVSAFRNVLAVGGALAVLLTGGVAFVVAARAATPVEALSRLSREIEETADFARRLPAQRSTKEMTEMADTFNRMIGRVEDMINAQRRFLSDTSHELRRPLTIIRTDIDILTDPGLSPEDLLGVQEEMRTAAASMSNLLTELLILARGEEDLLHKERVNLSALCRSVCQDIAAIHRNHSFAVHIPKVIWVDADRQRLERMISNVLLNAALYSGHAGVIECSLTTDASGARLSIKDSGPGIAPEELGNVFERFYRGTTGRRVRPEGTGLGLPIVKQVAVSHGGDVAIESQLGRGTTVTVRLPVISIQDREFAPIQAG